MSGQISDGMWENSRGTQWLWSNVWFSLGDETKVERQWGAPYGAKKSYPLTKELWDVVGDRILDENGFTSKKEAYAAWREIFEAIKNTQDLGPEIKAALAAEAKAITKRSQDVATQMTEEWICAGYKILEKTNSWTDKIYKERETIYLRPETKKGYLSVDTTVSEDGTKGYWKVGYGGTKFSIPAGHLQEGLAKIRNFFRDWEDWKEELSKVSN